jgi:RimJ/RimL family protein N-acetyltransferase
MSTRPNLHGTAQPHRPPLSPVTERETPRLLLRPPVPDDLDPYIEIHEDPEVKKQVTVQTSAVGRTAAWRMLAMLIGHWHILGYGQWTVIEKATGQVVGRVGLWNPAGWPGLELGWVIRRSRWGLGFATEAAREGLRFAFDAVGADHVISMIQSDNDRSIRVAEKIGERFERESSLDGAPMLVYGLTREGYLSEQIRTARPK